MDSLKQLQRQYVRFVKSLYRERTVDRQFINMQSDDPQNLSVLANDFDNMWERISQKLENAIEHKNINGELYDAVHQLKGSSMSIGAKKVTTQCLAFEDHYNARNHEACLRCLPEIKEEYNFLKNKLQMVLSLQQQIIGAGGSIPVLG